MRYGFSAVVQASMWVLIVVLALIMQVVPLLLILTLFNIAVGISSTAMLIIVPVALFVMLFVACNLAERRRKRILPAPRPTRAYAPPPANTMRGTAACMLPYLRRNRFY